MSKSHHATQSWQVISRAAGDRNLRLWNLLNQASEIIDGIEATLRTQRDQARESARAAADATSPRALRWIDLVREMHANSLQDHQTDRKPANRILETAADSPSRGAIQRDAAQIANRTNVLPFRGSSVH
ncbi:MAG: hypothetical protein RIF32_21960 [Leptospirales bacterium]|jgi:hypothetical protein